MPSGRRGTEGNSSCLCEAAGPRRTPPVWPATLPLRLVGSPATTRLGRAPRKEAHVK
jgi:hypothetical protein